MGTETRGCVGPPGASDARVSMSQNTHDTEFLTETASSSEHTMK